VTDARRAERKRRAARSLRRGRSRHFRIWTIVVGRQVVGVHCAARVTVGCQRRACRAGAEAGGLIVDHREALRARLYARVLTGVLHLVNNVSRFRLTEIAAGVKRCERRRVRAGSQRRAAGLSGGVRCA
jgi:hypothetical protein